MHIFRGFSFFNNLISGGKTMLAKAISNSEVESTTQLSIFDTTVEKKSEEIPVSPILLGPVEKESEKTEIPSLREITGREKAQRNKIVQTLKEAGSQGVTNIDIARISLSYTARITDLREIGYEIECKNLGKGVFLYVLIYEPIEFKKRKRAEDLFIEEIEKNTNGKADVSTILNILKKHNLMISRKNKTSSEL